MLQLNRRQLSVPANATALLFAILAGLHFLGAPSNAAEIVFDTYDNIFGKAQLGQTVRSGNHNLASGNAYGKYLGQRLYSSSPVSLAEAYSKLTFQRIGATSMFEFTTFANPGEFNSGNAQIFTSYPPSTTGYTWVYFTTRPSNSSEYFGKSITITFRASAQGTIISADNQANTFYDVRYPNGLFLSGRDYKTRFNQGAVTYRTTIGSRVHFAMQGAAQGTRRASANLTLKLDITAK